MVSIDAGACTACGRCVRVCHEHCMSLSDRVVRIDDAVCSTCTQCIAICPERALSWDGCAPEPFEPGELPTPRQLDELLGERRTVRQFRDEPVARGLVEEIVQTGVYAPVHSHDFRIVVAARADVLRALDAAILGYVRRMHRLLFGFAPLRGLIGALAGRNRGELRRARPKLELALKRGTGLSQCPPVMVFVVSPRRTPLARESGQYVLYTMMLAAQARGLGCRNLVGNQDIVDRDRPSRALLGLRPEERIRGMLGLGHPGVEYRNVVRARTLPVAWV